MSISRIPRAMAPDVTSTTSWPPARRAAACAQTSASTSRRTSPLSSATMLEPSLITIGAAISSQMLGAERRAGVELEQRAGDLHVVPGLVRSSLEPPDHAERAPALLHVRQR